MSRIWPFFFSLHYTDGSTNPSHFGTFLIFVCPGSSLKINFFASFWQDWRGGSIKTGGGGAIGQIVLKYKKFIQKSHQYWVNWK